MFLNKTSKIDIEAVNKMDDITEKFIIVYF